MPPKEPRNLAVTSVGASSVSLRWDGSRDNKDKLNVSYGVYRDGIRVLTTSATEATVTPLNCETRYSFAVDAVDNAGNRSDKIGISATTGTCPDLTPPSVPANLVVTSATLDSVTIGWSPSLDAVDGANVTYGVYRDGTRILTTGATEATITGLECGKSYALEVDAADTKDNRSPHAAISAPTLPCPQLTKHVAPGGTDFVRRWNHLAVTFDGSTLRLYLDGVLQQTLAAPGAMAGSDGPLRIGGDQLFNEFFRGRLDEARVYSRALSAAELAVDMETPIATRAGQAGLVAAFGFDEGTGNTTADASGNGPAATLEGPAWTTEGRYGNGLLFDTNGWVSVADRDSLDLTTGMTLEAWVDPGVINGWSTVMTKEAADYEVYGLFASTDTGLPEGDVYINNGDEDINNDYKQARGLQPLSLNTCTRALPCATFSAGYQAAQAGATVEVAAGSYPVQKIRGTKDAPGVVVRPAEGADVKVGGFDVYADNVELRNFNADYVAAYPESDGFTARNLDVGPMFIYGASNARVLGGDVGPSYNPGASSVVSYIGYGETQEKQSVAPQNVVLDGVYFHDFRRGGPEDHMECLHVFGGDGITIRNSKFVRCDVFSIFFTERGERPPKNILIENNFFDISTLDGTYVGCTEPDRCTYYAIRFSDQMSVYENITIRYNSSRQEFVVGQSPKINVKYVGNVAPLTVAGCDPDITFAYNVWDGAQCGPTDKNAPSGFVDPEHMDLHLLPGSAAVDAGDPTAFPADDIDGQSRPLGGGPDAGADESR